MFLLYFPLAKLQYALNTLDKHNTLITQSSKAPVLNALVNALSLG